MLPKNKPRDRTKTPAGREFVRRKRTNRRLRHRGQVPGLPDPLRFRSDESEVEATSSNDAAAISEADAVPPAAPAKASLSGATAASVDSATPNPVNSEV